MIESSEAGASDRREVTERETRPVNRSAEPITTHGIPQGIRSEEGNTDLAAALHLARHAFSPLDPGGEHSRGADFFATNPGQQIRAWIHKDGIELASGLPAAGTPQPWSVKLRLASFGRTGSIKPVSPERIRAISTRTESVDDTRGLTQWFENRKAGIEHGFTLAAAPEGEGDIEISMAVNGSTRPVMHTEGNSGIEGIRFVEPDGTTVVEYIGLKAWDAIGKVLDATMLVRGTNIVLRLNDDDACYPLTIDPLFVSPQARLTGNSAFIDAYFGESVSVSGDLAVIGSHQEDTPSGANAGAAYLFARSGSTWIPQGRITASNGDTGDEFGKSVALNGTTAVIGAPTTATSGIADGGKAFVFVQNGETWVEQASLPSPGGQVADQFGRSVSIAGDTAAIGAPGFDIPGGEDGGNVSFYVRSGSTWTLQQTINSTIPGEEFGYSTAIIGDRAVVGAHLSSASGANQAGRAYVLSRNGSTWTLETSPLQAPSPSAAQEFGYSVALSGDTVMVGGLQGGKAYAFVRNGFSWNLERVFSNNAGLFGVSVAISGNTAVVGAEYDSTTGGINAGGAYVYVRNSGIWIQEAKLQASDSSAFDLFGRSVSISGNTILIGAPYDDTSSAINAGCSYFFERSVVSWSEQAKVTAGESGVTGLFGFSTDLSGDTAVVGASLEDTAAGADVGVSYVFMRQEGDIWSQQARLTANDASEEDHFGNSVAISGDFVVVGARDDDTGGGTDSGSAYFFTRIGNEWTQRQKLPGENDADEFGESVAIDGDIVIVGAPDLYTFVPPSFALVVGGAYAYRWSGSTLLLETKLLPSVDRGFLRLGDAAAIDGDTAILGAPLANTPSSSNAGAAFVFKKSNGFWSQQAKLSASDGLAIDEFGDAVAIDGDVTVIGAKFGDTAGKSDSGGAYVFEREGNSWMQAARLAPSTSAADDYFGYSVGVSGTTAVVGSPSTNSPSGMDVGNAHVFQKSGPFWNQQGTLSAGLTAASTGFFGAAIAIENDTVVVGAPGEDSTGGEAAGSLYVFLIGELPVIVEQPVSRTVPLTNPGTTVSFAARVSGYAPIQYQWRKNGTAIPGASGIIESETTTYTIPETSEADAGIFDVVITNAGGVTTSAPATLTVNALSAFEQSFPIAPPDSLGFVFVTLAPSGVGGWRFQGEQLWRASGVPVGGLATGDRVIEFRPVPGFLQPPQETVGVISGGAATFIERFYYESPVSGTGGMAVILKPDALALASVPEASRAQWRLLGEDDNQWKDSETTLAGLIPGGYLIECKPVAGRTTPPPSAVLVVGGQTATPTITYFLAVSTTGTLPNVIPFENVSTNEDMPYAYVGQIRSSAGAGSGFVVMPRVVATAGHVVFDDGTLSAAINLQWLFQRHSGAHEPKPQIPRGFYIFDGYAAQRALDASPGSSSPESQNLDAAAIYFPEDAARGGFGGFLASDALNNEFLISSANKTLIGYPVDGITPINMGRMHATPPADVTFARAFGKTYTTAEIRSTGGSSGGPLCVQFENGVYYPAAIFLGGNGQTVVRSIDSAVIDLFNRANVSANGGDNNTGGGITHTSVVGNLSTTLAGSLRVNIEPASVNTMGAAWRINPETSLRQGGSQKSGLSPGTYSLGFSTIVGFQAPAAQMVAVTGGQLTTITYTYTPIVSQTPLETWRQTHFGTTANTGDAADDFDFDKDGETNIDEFTAGTNPASGSDVFEMATTAKSGNTFTTSCVGKADRTYTLLRNTGLTGEWTRLESQGPLTGDGTVTLSDTSAPTEKSFYRIEVSFP